MCRLAHCDVPDREFETVAAWRKHVALARSHLEDGKRHSFTATFPPCVYSLSFFLF